MQPGPGRQGYKDGTSKKQLSFDFKAKKKPTTIGEATIDFIVEKGRQPKPSEVLQIKEKLKVNKSLSNKKTVPIVRPKFVSFPANFADVKWSKAVKGWRGGALFEIVFGVLDYWDQQSKGKEGGWGGQAMANAIQTASWGVLKTGDKKYVYELLRLGKEMGFDTTALEHVIDINKRDNVLTKVEASNASHLEAIKKKDR